MIQKEFAIICKTTLQFQLNSDFPGSGLSYPEILFFNGNHQWEVSACSLELINRTFNNPRRSRQWEFLWTKLTPRWRRHESVMHWKTKSVFMSCGVSGNYIRRNRPNDRSRVVTWQQAFSGSLWLGHHLDDQDRLPQESDRFLTLSEKSSPRRY